MILITSINISNAQKCVESIPININLIPLPYWCAFSRLFWSHDVSDDRMHDNFFIFSNFARQRVRLHKISVSEEEKSSSDEKWRVWRDVTNNLVWFLFTARRSSRLHRVFDVGYRDSRSKFRLRRFHVRIDTIYARLIFPVEDDSALIVSKADLSRSLSSVIDFVLLSKHACIGIIDTNRFKRIIQTHTHLKNIKVPKELKIKTFL